MRALVEDTKKLTVNNTIGNYNNNNIQTAVTVAVTSITSTATTKAEELAIITTSSSLSNTVTTTAATAATKTSFTNKTYKMQQQQQQQQQHQHQQQQQQQQLQQMTIMRTTILNNKGHNCPTTGVKLRTKQTQHHNNNIASTGNATAAVAAASTGTNTTTIVALPKSTHANQASEEISGGVQDTIYLCNFRVSVDGEWLCLKELQDIDSSGNTATTSSKRHSQYTQQKNKRWSAGDRNSYGGIEDNGIFALHNFIAGRRLFDYEQEQTYNTHMLTAAPHAREPGFVGVFGGGGGVSNSNEWSHLSRDPAEIERSNLVNICKLVVKELLEQSLRYGRMLDSDHLPLQHFFIVIEHVLGHGLRTKKGLLGPRKELWDLLQCVENYCPEAQDITASVRDLPTVRTHIGRARAWLRIALMQKKLADYLQALIEHRDDALYEYYEPHALMMSDEIVVIMGILVGLNVIDCNLCVKEEDLDSQQGVIDFSLYLRSSSRNNDNNGDDDDDTNQILDANGQGNMIAVLDQKNYIEELNRHLNATVANLQAKVESLTTTNALMKEDLAIARNSLLALQAENQAMRQSAGGGGGGGGPPSLSSTHSDNSTNSKENATNDKTLLESLKLELEKEKKRSTELDKELKLQISLKAESDMAMKLLEKDIHDKQDTIISLRRQLDEIKQINLEMYRKLQECEDELTQKGEMVARLQNKASQIGNILQSLEKKYETKAELKLQQHHQSWPTSGGGEGGMAEKSPGTRRQQNLQKFEALTKKTKQDIGPPMKRLHLKVDAIPPFNPNNYRKSPSNPTAPDKYNELNAEVKTPSSAKSLKFPNDDITETDIINNLQMPSASLPNDTSNSDDHTLKESNNLN
ncbi:RUN and FYVE domain-containing protein 2 isoform X3 [Glossina fuscipes]|uniref:RUN and FYVE domain-containing protein 2 isoform X3 n=1 Tax=Glossina fuscipes TaxID=7396 RepID=A0A9C5Z9W8_9MUSC|nr:RUN and FYVE domain-containing protein 2 isoform X3 [Glossina fuscipes]